MNVKPIGNLYLVKPFAASEQTSGGIFIPENIRERGAKAKVLAKGGGTQNRPMEVPINATVWHIKGAGEELIVEGESLYLVKDVDILGYMLND